jgi:hypothetical protein
MKRRDFFKQTLAVAGLTTVGASLRNNVFAALEANKLLSLAGTRSPSPSNYTRMFPKLPPQGANNPRLEEGLIALGQNMREDSNEPPDCKDTPIAGYTYLGQFIDHDLTLDVTPLAAANPRPEQTTNFRTPFLDLDQLYGGGPNLSPFLYRNEQKNHDAQRFLVGKTIRPDNQEGSDNDLPRSPEGIALTGDPRQDENLILAQLHVAFLKIHNSVLDKLKNGELQSAGPEGGTRFEQARRLVNWHYQWIVRNDYLKTILDPNVFNEISKPGYKPKLRSLAAGFRIPVEFSAAAFRFGHSMVRNQYLITMETIDGTAREKTASLRTLLQLTGTGGGVRTRLPSDWIVCWQFFFVTSGGIGSAQHASAIDTRIAGGLYGLGEETRALFSAPMPDETMAAKKRTEKSPENDLPVITLLRGARLGLPSGQRAAKALGVQPLDPEKEIAPPNNSHSEILKTYRFHKDTPLWYYILKESELRENGCRLGPTGSKIVSDVILSALLQDPNSYLSTQPDWKPILPTRKKDQEGFDISDLIRFSIDANWPQDSRNRPCVTR